MNASFEPKFRYVYGPVPSWRLGRSLGVDVVPFKTCTFDCAYCQLGRTTRKTVTRSELLPVGEILAEVGAKLALGDEPDYVTIAGSGEPTLHARLGELVRGVHDRTDRPVAVLTNGSLLADPAVRDALRYADVVLPSLDAGDETTFRLVNRPHRSLDLAGVVDGLVAFSADFPGEIRLEVFLLDGVSGTREHVGKIAALARRISPDRVQLTTASRPPTEYWARPVAPDLLESFRGLFSVPVDVPPVEEERPARPGARTSLPSEEEVLALLRRRPSTVPGVATGLGIPAPAASKLLAGLLCRGLARGVPGTGTLFFEPAEPADRPAPDTTP